MVFIEADFFVATLLAMTVELRVSYGNRITKET